MWLNQASYLAHIWSPTDHDSSWTISGANLVATMNATPSGYTAARGAYRFANKAKVYFEITTNATGQLIGVGVMNASASTASYVGSDTNGVSYYQNGSWSYNGPGIATNAPASSGASAVIGVAWDGINQNIWVRIATGNWNGSSSADPATNSLGFNAPLTGTLMIGITGNSSGSGATLNAGSTSFTGTVPIGFIPPNASINTA